MSLRQIVELVIHIENFRNIELYYQGLYYLKFTCYYDSEDGQKIYAHPYALSESFKAYPELEQKSQQYRIGDTQQFYKEAQLLENTSQFCSKQFYIKYCEEEVELNDFCFCRLEIDFKPKNQKIELNFDVELMFYDCLNNQQQNPSQIGQQNKNQEMPQEAKVLDVAKFKIKEFTSGLHEFIPVTFQEQHFCVANVLFHSILLGSIYIFLYNTFLQIIDIESVLCKSVNFPNSNQMKMKIFLIIKQLSKKLKKLNRIKYYRFMNTQSSIIKVALFCLNVLLLFRN